MSPKSDSSCELCGDRLTRIEGTVNDIHRRLFMDEPGGGPSIQTRLDRHDQSIARGQLFSATAITAGAGAILAELIAWIFRGGTK